MKFAIRIEETLARTVIVEADSSANAIGRVMDALDNYEICLGCDDFFERTVQPSQVFDNGIVPDNRDVSFYEHLK